MTWSKPEKMPRHVAIIMDGNGRWAKQHGFARVIGHRRGVEALREIVRESSDLGIEVLTLYAFSTENWKRSSEEVGALMGLVLEFFKKEIDELDKNHVAIRILGDVEGLPEAQRKTVCLAMERTKENRGLQLNIALNYGGRDEIRRAVKKLVMKVQAGEIRAEDITEDMIAQSLDTAGQPDVDLLIRTAADQRLSNFLPYQSTYAELLFPSVLWPDFNADAYHEALDIFAGRERRFGGRKEETK